MSCHNFMKTSFHWLYDKLRRPTRWTRLVSREYIRGCIMQGLADSCKWVWASNQSHLKPCKQTDANSLHINFAFIAKLGVGKTIELSTTKQTVGIPKIIVSEIACQKLSLWIHLKIYLCDLIQHINIA